MGHTYSCLYDLAISRVASEIDKRLDTGYAVQPKHVSGIGELDFNRSQKCTVAAHITDSNPTTRARAAMEINR